MNINKEIEKYVVHLKFRDNNGSGVLFKPYETSEYCYLFTAKHNFEEKDEYGDKKFFSPLKYHYDFEIVRYDFSQLKIDSIIEIEDKLGQIDLLILSIKNYNYSCWKDIKPLKVFSGDFKKEMNYVIGGFPAILKHNELEFYDCKFVIDNLDSTLEVESKRILSTSEINELETNRGISGGGLFVQENDNKIYLLGIEIEFKPRHNLKCINLQGIVDILNNKISSLNLDKIIMGGYPLLDKYSLADRKFDLSLIETDLENDYIKKVKDKSIEFLRDNSEQVNKDLHDRYSKVLLEMKDLANSYLYRGAVFNGKYNQLATNNLKKAIQLNEELEIYLAQAKYVRTKDNKKRIDNKLKRDNKLQIDILKGKILETDNLKELKKLYVDLLFYLSKYQDFYKEDIKFYQEKLIDEVYIKKLDFKEAERILNSDLNKFLDRNYIRNRLFKIYLNKAYPQSTKLSKKEFADKLFTLLGMFDFESDKYLIIRRRIEDLNVFDNFIISLNENLIKSEREFNIYKKKINQLTKQVIFLSKYVSEEKLLHEINFKIFNSNKKLDNIEKLQNSSINTTLGGIKATFHKKNKDNNKNTFILFLIFFILGLLALDNQTIIELLNHYYNIFLDFIKNY